MAKKTNTTKITWEKLSFIDEWTSETPWSNDYRASSCCGVCELEGLDTKKFNIEVCEKEPDECLDRQLKYRPATWKEIVRAFKEYEKEQAKRYGMFVTYLLPSQHNGDFGKMIRECNWTYHGKFWNPKTRHTLHHYSKVLKKQQPKKKKSSKSVFKR